MRSSATGPVSADGSGHRGVLSAGLATSGADSRRLPASMWLRCSILLLGALTDSTLCLAALSEARFPAEAGRYHGSIRLAQRRTLTPGTGNDLVCVGRMALQPSCAVSRQVLECAGRLRLGSQDG